MAGQCNNTVCGALVTVIRTRDMKIFPYIIALKPR